MRLHHGVARILIIEDDAELVQLLSLGLFKAGYEVHYAFNGKEGYEKILSLHPDLILLDLMRCSRVRCLDSQWWREEAGGVVDY